MIGKSFDRRLLSRAALGLAAFAALPAVVADPAAAASNRTEIDTDVAAALARLHTMENARPLFSRARAVLVFPRIVSGGFIVGGQYGEGALMVGNTHHGYYNIAGASFGLLAGAQAAGLAMFFMTQDALSYLDRSDGWEIGSGPTVVALDRGVQANVTSTTLTEPVYAITFNQQGLMAAIALNGTKISHIRPE